jgi:hypothetical protein
MLGGHPRLQRRQRDGVTSSSLIPQAIYYSKTRKAVEEKADPPKSIGERATPVPLESHTVIGANSASRASTEHGEKWLCPSRLLK